MERRVCRKWRISRNYIQSSGAELSLSWSWNWLHLRNARLIPLWYFPSLQGSDLNLHDLDGWEAQLSLLLHQPILPAKRSSLCWLLNLHRKRLLFWTSRCLFNLWLFRLFIIQFLDTTKLIPIPIHVHKQLRILLNRHIPIFNGTYFLVDQVVPKRLHDDS